MLESYMYDTCMYYTCIICIIPICIICVCHALHHHLHIHIVHCTIKLWSCSCLVFSVTRRYRSDAGHLLTYSLMVSIDLTDVTLVSDDT